MVFQNYALYPHMTVFDNIAFPLMVRKRELGLTNEEIRRRVMEIAKLLQIDHLLNRKPSQLSGGEQQRVALARALVRRPKVWLLDEPMSNLDAKLRVTMRGELKKLQKELGVTTIYVTHDQVEAMSMADRIAVMNKGRILQIGTPDELFWKPADTFVATFIGTPPMNIIECSVEERDRSTRLNCEEFSLELAGVLADAVKKRTSDKVFLGIRPDHMTISKTRSSPESIEGTITITEKLGVNQIVYVNIAKEGAKIIRVVAPGEITFNPGEKVYVTLDKNRIYVFDGVTQKALI
jgi:multiple sugar transport system ATP-binding protein